MWVFRVFEAVADRNGLKRICVVDVVRFWEFISLVLFLTLVGLGIQYQIHINWSNPPTVSRIEYEDFVVKDWGLIVTPLD